MRQLIILIIGLAIGGAHVNNSRDNAADSNGPAVSAVRKSFRIFQATSEPLPIPVRAHLSRLLQDPQHPFKPHLVQRSRTANGVIVWAFVIREQVCLARGSHGGASCDAFDAAVSEGVSLGTFSPPSAEVPRPHQFSLTGLVPDRVFGVKIAIGHRIEVLRVHHNLYSITADRPIFIST